jgi:hypothetical protein
MGVTIDHITSQMITFRLISKILALAYVQLRGRPMSPHLSSSHFRLDLLQSKGGFPKVGLLSPRQ